MVGKKIISRHQPSWSAVFYYANAKKLIFDIILVVSGKGSRRNIVFLVVILLECCLPPYSSTADI